MDRDTDGQRHGRTETRTDRDMDGQRHRQTETRMDRGTDGQRHGWTEAQTDRDTDGQTQTAPHPRSLQHPAGCPGWDVAPTHAHAAHGPGPGAAPLPCYFPSLVAPHITCIHPSPHLWLHAECSRTNPVPSQNALPTSRGMPKPRGSDPSPKAAPASCRPPAAHAPKGGGHQPCPPYTLSKLSFPSVPIHMPGKSWHCHQPR